MHKIASKEFTLDDFSCEHLMEWGDYEDEAKKMLDPDRLCNFKFYMLDTVSALNNARHLYRQCEERLKRTDLTEAERKHITSMKNHFWWQMIQLLPSSYNQRRTVMLNYEVLANIYKSRKNHKLDEWCLHETPEEPEFRNKDFTSGMWGFCDWIESLPCSELITGKENN